MSRPIPQVASPVRPAVDLEASGKTVGHLLVPTTDNAHAYSVVPVPIAVIAGGPGPTALLVAGTHGDEWEGQLILRRLVEEVDPGQVHGRLFVLPSFNLPAVRASTRCSPLDGGDMNRAFPGRSTGGPTEVLAHFVEHVLLAGCTFAVDLHSGGSASEYVPCAFLRIDDDSRRTKEKLAATAALGLAHALVVGAGGEARTLSAAADRQGVVLVATELAGAGRVEPSVLVQADRALRRLLDHWGLLDAPSAPREGERADTRFWLLGPASGAVVGVAGLLEPVARLGDAVRAGDVVARVRPLEQLMQPAHEVLAPIDGTVVVVRTPPLVAPGDIAVTVGAAVAPDDLITSGVGAPGTGEEQR